MGVPQPPMGGPPQGLSRFFSPEVLAQAQGGHAPPPPMPSQKVLTLEEIERQGLWERSSYPSLTREEVGTLEGEADNRHYHVISGPEMSLTTEEINYLDSLVEKQVTTCKNCMPVR